MFDSLTDAKAALGHSFEGPPLAAVLRTLAPALVFEPASGGVLGGTRLGGTPDLPAGTAWPRPPAPESPDEIAGRGNEDAKAWMLQHFALGLPYAFIAQVDLAEAAALGAPGADLPPDGRLLFFYDLVAGPWDPGPRAARVLWDRTSREDLVRQDMPADLAEARARQDAEMAALRAQYNNSRSVEEEGSNYDAPARDMRLRHVVRLPHRMALESEDMPEFEALFSGAEGSPEEEAFYDAYEEAVRTYDDTEKAPGTTQQLLGVPEPVQNDPRLAAAELAITGWHLSREQWEAHEDQIRVKARDWRLLLQINLSDWMRAEFVEGMVYFLIRSDDLAARRFEAVVAVYQQT